ncbi:MAG: hypothetical protein Q9178_000504 [Gyalolechia marmorata]
MSEYWKSTPKYWCKHCKTFVRDTKLEKSNHEATAKHQGNIKRFLRDLHRGHEREEREKDRAKNEVERLNGVVLGTSSATQGGPPWSKQTASSLSLHPREATPAERKAQLARLAEMGIAVPEDFRREMAMAGDWQTIAERPMVDRVKKEEGLEDFKHFQPDPTLNIGVRKRKFEGQEEEEDVGATVVRKGWGSTVRHYPGTDGDGQDELDSLLNDAAALKRQASGHEMLKPISIPEAERATGQGAPVAVEPDTTPPSIKKEESHDIDPGVAQYQEAPSGTTVKQENDTQPAAVVFKKRKSKAFGKPEATAPG